MHRNEKSVYLELAFGRLHLEYSACEVRFGSMSWHATNSGLIVILCVLVANADIADWRTGETIPGSELLIPGPGVDWSSDRTSPRNLQYADLSGLDLSEANFHFVQLNHAKLSGANLEGVNFIGADLTSADLTDSNLFQADMGTIFPPFRPVLKDAKLNRADLTETVFVAADLTGADFTDAIILGANFSSTDGFSRQQLTSTASYKSKNLEGVTLGGHDLSGVDFSSHNLFAADFSGADLLNTNFSDSIITWSSFSNVTDTFTQDQLYSTASYENKNLRGVSLANTSNSLKSIVSGWDFSSQDLLASSFRYANATQADFTSANLTHAEFWKTHLAGANFSGAVLKGTDFRDVADLGSAVFSKETLYDERTRFPLGFSPDEFGLSFVPTIKGDIDGVDGLTISDLDLIVMTFAYPSYVPSIGTSAMDLTGDSRVDEQDAAHWITSLKNTRFGDANLDGIVSFSDFLLLADNFGDPGSWKQGDFDHDRKVTFSDFLILASNFGEPATATIPEPDANLLLIVCIVSGILPAYRPGSLLAVHSSKRSARMRRTAPRLTARQSETRSAVS